MEVLLDILRQYQHLGLIGFVVAVFLTPLAIRAAHRFGVLDVPDKQLKPHAKPTPYLGGLAICAAWVLVGVVAIVSGVCRWQIMLPLLLGGMAMSILGLVDDARGVRPKMRLLVGGIVISLAIVLSGTGFGLVDSFLIGVSSMSGVGLSLPAWISVPASVAICVFIILGACNSANLIDGLDGLCSGVTGIISVGFFLLASHLAVWNYSDTGDPVRLVLAIGMLGATLGFLPWNFNPAKIFMGDAGSVLLGYNCGMLIVLFGERGTTRWVIGALMIFALPVFDTALAMCRRWMAGRSIFEGDRSHFYDQLVQRGFTVRQTVLVCYALTLVYAGIGLLLTWVRTLPDGSALPVIRTRYAVPLYLAVCLITAGLAWFMGLISPDERRSGRRTPPAEAGLPDS